jgi:Na+-transporting NADH:ubiquinone oxidoreductase subunit C
LQQPSNARTVTFIVILCLVSALILAVLATALSGRQLKAKQLDQAKQMLQAAQIYTPEGYFQVLNDQGEWESANYDATKGMLVAAEELTKGTEDQIYAVFNARLKPYLTNSQGEVTTFEAAGIDIQDYIDENQVAGYAKLPEKLFYAILPNYSTAENPSGEELDPGGYIIPVAGFGLWGPIYGYLALEPNADTVIGTTWTAPLETPGLGAIITEPKWQAQFEGKEIFLPSAEGETNLGTAALGLTVVKGKVSDVFRETPRAETAVDGITGATLTCDGVTAAYHASLGPYRPFLEQANKAFEAGNRLEGIAYGS